MTVQLTSSVRCRYTRSGLPFACMVVKRWLVPSAIGGSVCKPGVSVRRLLFGATFATSLNVQLVSSATSTDDRYTGWPSCTPENARSFPMGVLANMLTAIPIEDGWGIECKASPSVCRNRRGRCILQSDCGSAHATVRKCWRPAVGNCARSDTCAPQADRPLAVSPPPKTWDCRSD